MESGYPRDHKPGGLGEKWETIKTREQELVRRCRIKVKMAVVFRQAWFMDLWEVTGDTEYVRLG